MSAEKIKGFRDLRVYQAAMDVAMEIFKRSKQFPPRERYNLTDQIRRSSRSVCANIAEAWRKRRYAAYFQSKLSDAETEADETRVWLEFALRCNYLSEAEFSSLDDAYDRILGQLVRMISDPGKWTLGR